MSMQPKVIETIELDDLLLRRRRLVRDLRKAGGLRELRLAVLGGSTTAEIVQFLEVLLLASGFDPVFYESEYDRFYQDAVLDSEALIAFRPELVYIHTSSRNIISFPSMSATELEHQEAVSRELERFRQIWHSIQDQIGCQMLQNNFELPLYAIMGNLDAVASGGRSRFLMDLNAVFAAEARTNPRLLIQDLHGISSRIGLERWFDWNRWYSYKLFCTAEGTLSLARSLTAMIKAIYGRSRKVLVLDLDNTLWGGVIGDDGVDRIQIGRETPVAEAYTAFQEYCALQRQRGVLLAVCSKNDEAVAKSGFAHPDSVLKIEDFSFFKANWEPKHENILEAARDLNLGTDSFVFVDDNPAERAIIEAQVPGVAVPNVGSDVAAFISLLDSGRFFEAVSLSKEDFARAAMYANRSEQVALQSKFANYGEYLDSLEMTAEIDSFQPVYLDRIAQLTNKTNQFHLTTRRSTAAEIAMFAADPAYVTLYGRLSDRFADNGLVTVLLGRKQDRTLHLELWLMSCRVLKRDMELAMLDVLVERASAAGISTLVGYYIPTNKNGMVADHYERLGFERMGEANGTTTWQLKIDGYAPRNEHIRVVGVTHG